MNFETRGVETGVNKRRRLDFIQKLLFLLCIAIQMGLILHLQQVIDRENQRLTAYSHEIDNQFKEIKRLRDGCGGEVQPGIFDEKGCHTDGDLRVCTRINQDTITNQ